VPPRRGDIHKCPVCGSSIDAEAYCCAKCRNYFCFHCRARLLPSDEQLQCTNQRCDYYGKLVCESCDPRNEKEVSPSVYAEPEDGYWPAWLVLVVLGAAVIWYGTSSFPWAIAIGIIAFAGGGYCLQRAGVNLFGQVRTVEHQRKSNFHACIRCQQPVKQLPRKA
jgi:hypothetical protein